MTVVNPKSISGINSITMASGSDNLLTIHSNNTTERVRVNNSGDVIIGSGVTLSPDGDIFATGITTISENLKVGTGVTISPDGDGFFTGVITATSYSGIDLSDVTGATGDFSIADKIVHTGDTDTAIRFSGADTITAETGGSERVRIDSNGYAGIGANDPHLYYSKTLVVNAGDTEGDGGGITIKGGSTHTNYLMFADSNSGAARYDGYVGYNQNTQKLVLGAGQNPRAEIDSNGHLAINDGNLVIATSGHGIDFSATSDSSGTMSNELLADYEEGTFTCTLTGSSSNPSYTTSSNTGFYVRIGNFVSLYYLMVVNGVSGQGSGNWQIEGIPFSHDNSVGGYRSNGVIGYNDIFDFEVHKLYITNSDKLLIIPNGVTQSNQTYSQNPLSTGYFSFSITYKTDS